VHEDLRVAERREAVPAPLEFSPQFAIVEDFAILHNVDRSIFIRDRLVTAGEIDDRKPPRSNSHRAVDEGAAAVWTTVNETFVHPVDDIPVDRAALQGNQAAYAAHRQISV
jgi:hypothetical protein